MRMYKNAALVLTSILMVQFSFGQIKKVKFEELDSLQKVQKRPVVVFLHTSWCKYCILMENTTFSAKKVEELLNQNFYFVSLDVEERHAISFQGHIFKYKPTDTTTGVHELAEQLGFINGQLAYPSTCFLNENYEIIYQKEGFIDATKFTEMLTKLK
jgi:thioredoxin-related protein